MKKLYISIMLTLIAVVISCAKKTTTSTVAKAPTVTYALNIQPFLETKCTPCHIPAKGGFKTAFDTYEAAKAYIDPMINRVQIPKGEKGFMPMKKEALSAEEIALLKKWKEEGLAK